MPQRGSFVRGFLAGGAVNLSVGTVALWYGLFMSFGMGLSSNPDTDRVVLRSIWAVGLCCPCCANLPGLIYGLAGPRWKFLGGWGAGLLAGFAVVAAQVGLVALYLLFLARQGG